LIICAGYKPIIKKEFLQLNNIINIHYSLLPKFRGLHSTVWAILNNEPFLGYTIHIMNEFIDDGDIIFQHKTENIATKSSADYMHYFNKHVEENLGVIVENYINGKTIPYPQDKSTASWVSKRSLEDCRIDFNLTSNEIANLFRALVPPYPPPFFEYKGKKHFPANANFHFSNIKTHIGRILNIDDEGVWIKIKDGYAIFNKISSESGQLIQISSYKIGHYLNINT
jgi:methionyl-tRNA formyltransferase